MKRTRKPCPARLLPYLTLKKGQWTQYEKKAQHSVLVSVRSTLRPKEEKKTGQWTRSKKSKKGQHSVLVSVRSTLNQKRRKKTGQWTQSKKPKRAAFSPCISCSTLNQKKRKKNRAGQNLARGHHPVFQNDLRI